MQFISLGAIDEFRCCSIDGGGLEAAQGNGENNLSLWWFLKVTEEKEYTCVAEHFYQDQNI